VPSPASVVARTRPSGLNATLDAGPDPASVMLARLHTRTVPLSLPVTRNWPSAVKPAAWTVSGWGKVPRTLPLAASNRYTT
jgi:hypothetical protein